MLAGVAPIMPGGMQVSVVARFRDERARLTAGGSPGRRLARGGTWSLVAAAFGLGSTLIVSIIAARVLGADDYGRLVIVNATTGMLGVFAGLGMGLTATKAVAEFRERDAARLARILALLGRMVLLSGALASGLLLIAAPLIAGSALGQPELTPLIQLAAVQLLLNELAGVQTGILAGFEHFRSIAIVAILRAAATLALSPWAPCSQAWRVRSSGG